MSDIVGTAPAPSSSLVVYTALFGGYDTLQEPAVVPTACRFICFTDDRTLTSGRWRVVHVEPTMDPAMMNRYIKLHPHKFLPDHDLSIYIDANLRMRRDPKELVDEYMTGAVFAAPVHPMRNCVYDEIDACIEVGKVDAAAARAQAERYRRAGYPAQHGLTENRVLIRRHRDPAVVALMEAWWAELVSGIRRDQACLQFVCWKRGFSVRLMREDIIYGRHFIYRPHRNERFSVRAKLHVLMGLKRLGVLAQRMTGAGRSRRLVSRS